MIVAQNQIIRPGKFISTTMQLDKTILKFLEVAKSGVKEDIDTIYTEYVSILLDTLEKNGEERQLHRAMAAADSNIGYMSGYMSNEDGAKMREVFGTPHPLFGYGSPSAEEAFDIGMRMASGDKPEIKELPNKRKWDSKRGVIIV